MATSKSSFELQAPYSQIAVFSAGLAAPYNDWEERHVTQGFAWRQGSVSFATPSEDAIYEVGVSSADTPPPLTHDIIRAVQVPFTVPADGMMEVGSVMTTRIVRMPPGNHILRCAFAESHSDDRIDCLLTFHAPVGEESFRILVADDLLNPDEPFLIGSH